MPIDFHASDYFLSFFDFANKTFQLGNSLALLVLTRASQTVGDVKKLVFSFPLGWKIPNQVDTGTRMLEQVIQRRVCQELEYFSIKNVDLVSKVLPGDIERSSTYVNRI